MSDICRRTAVAATVLCCASAGSAAVVFEQDFTGATLASLTGTGTNQFTALPQGTNATDPHTFSIVGDSLHAKNAVDTSYPTARATGTNFTSPLGATPFALTFVAAPIATVSAGNTGVTVYVNAGGRQLRLDLRIAGTAAAPGMQPRAEGGASLSTFTAPVNILVVGNPSPLPYVYDAPNGTSRSVDSLKWDVWAGTSSSSLSVPLTVTANSDRLELQMPGWSTANGTISLDNLRLETVPEPSAALVLLGASALGLRRRRR